MATGSRSSTPNTREWDEEEEEQGSRVFYRGEWRWGATHQKQMRWGWNTQMVHAVEIRSETWCASCVSGGGGNKGEERGPLDEAGVRAVVSPKEEGKEREGGPIRGTRHGSREPTGCWGKRRNAQCTKTASTARCRGHAKMGS